MTKRPFSFETGIYRQSKIHLNDYENDLTALKEMEERTLRKLIEGSKKSSTQRDFNSNHQIQTLGNDNRSFMQKCVTNYFTVNGRKVNENGIKIVNQADSISRCFFCESGDNAIYQCVQCLEFYCSACSFVNYDSFDDNRTCLSCL